MIRYILALVMLASVAHGQNASIRTNNILALSGSASPLAIQQTLPFRLTEYAKSGAVNAYNLTGKEVRWELLDSRESRILKLRFGIGNSDPMTLKAIGKRFGLTRERVRQMEQQALEKLGLIMSREFGEERAAPRPRRAQSSDR